MAKLAERRVPEWTQDGLAVPLIVAGQLWGVFGVDPAKAISPLPRKRRIC